MIHDVKVSWMYFEDVLSGKKPFELRWDDRGYAVGRHAAFERGTGWCLHWQELPEADYIQTV